VHRAKRQLEKIVAQGGKRLPSYLVNCHQLCGQAGHRGVPQDVRRLTVAVYEHAVESAIGRGLLGRGDRENPSSAHCSPACSTITRSSGSTSTAPVSTEIARTLKPAASSGATLVRLVFCLSRALADANCALWVLILNCSAKLATFRNEYPR
jgi:hypothetical protein